MGIVMIGSAISMVISRNMIMSILSMILTFLSLAVLFLTLDAQFLAIMEVVVYAGGIIVLFLFVIMLLNVEQAHHTTDAAKLKGTVGIAFGVAFLVEIAVVILSSASGNITSLPAHAAQLGTVEFIGKALYTSYLFPFEIVSLLLLAAMVGALFLAKKRLN